MKHLALHAGEREDRDEGKDDDDHGKGDRPAHKPRCIERDLPDVVAIVAVLLFVLLGLADDVLGHDDSRVYEHANGDGDSAQRHDVRRDARALHEQESAQYRERQRDGDHQDAAKVPQKQHVRQRDQNQLFDQRVAERVHCMIDEGAAVIERNDLDARGEARLNLADLLLDCLNYLPRIGAIADDDHPARCFFPVLSENAAPELGAKLNTGHVANRYRRAVESAERDVLNVLQSANQADAAHHFLGVAYFDDLGADVVVASLHRGNHILERNVVGAQLHGIEIDLVLLYESANGGDFGHSGYGVQLVLDEPVLDGVKRTAVVGALDRVPVDLAHSGCVRPHHRRHAGGQKAARQAEPFQHTGPREVDVHRVLEDDVDHRKAEGRRRADGAHVRQPLQVHGERVGNLVFNFLRTAALPLGEHDDLVFAQVGNGIDRRVQQRPIAPNRQRSIDGQNQPAVLHGEFDYAVDHYFSFGGFLPGAEVRMKGSDRVAVSTRLDKHVPRPRHRRLAFAH